jgi:hypothetical protein
MRIGKEEDKLPCAKGVRSNGERIAKTDIKM